MDIIENINGSVIQHGPHNDRIYLMKPNMDDTPGLIGMLDDLASRKGYGKIFAKIPAHLWHAYQSAGYIKEAAVPRFYGDGTEVFFISKYFSAKRQKVQIDKKLSKIIETAESASADTYAVTAESKQVILSCKPSDAEELSKLYRQVFKTYPFPIQEPSYLKQMMETDVLYFCIRIRNQIVSTAAAEIDTVNQNAEMTDFASLPKWRGMGFAGMILKHMERKMGDLGIMTVYTIARAASHGMNMVFRKNGYTYSGLLKNNTQICGSIQNMTVWYKQL